AFCVITLLIKRSSCLHCKSSSLLLQTEPGQGLWPMPITKQEIGIQTDTHPIDTYIDKSYEWNEWELRRKAIKLGCNRLIPVEDFCRYVCCLLVMVAFAPTSPSSQQLVVTKTVTRKNYSSLALYLALSGSILGDGSGFRPLLQCTRLCGLFSAYGVKLSFVFVFLFGSIPGYYSGFRPLTQCTRLCGLFSAYGQQCDGRCLLCFVIIGDGAFAPHS
ncbi:hypothetical protein GOODEAATRI_023757, partial [Goodea atripinnis]